MNPSLLQPRLLEHLPVAVSVAAPTPDCRVLLSNRQFERLFGYSPQDMPTVDDWARLVSINTLTF